MFIFGMNARQVPRSLRSASTHTDFQKAVRCTPDELAASHTASDFLGYIGFILGLYWDNGK